MSVQGLNDLGLFSSLFLGTLLGVRWSELAMARMGKCCSGGTLTLCATALNSRVCFYTIYKKVGIEVTCMLMSLI